ncbi:MAG TPA: hypothetical protein VF520_05300 [Thermoleophilaceae bacterium]|jgi:nicotinic acid phosphoribosyltransferase
MRFPRIPPANADAHESARARLDEARGEERRLAARRNAADSGPAEAHAATELSAAGEQVAAREAWAEWASSEE